MKLLFLYGPPAVGKLTIAKELRKQLGFKLLYNHQLISIFDDLFPFENKTRRDLTREFRRRIIEEAIAQDINIIITTGNAGSTTFFDYFSEIIDLVESKGSEVHLVHLTADEKTLLDRVENDFRRQHGKHFGKKELQKLFDEFSTLFDKYPNRKHITIDTRNNNPEESAKKIITHFTLKKS